MTEHAADPQTTEVIVVVDDEPLMRDTMAMALSGFGLTVLTAENGTEALDCLIKRVGAYGEHNVRVIISDWMMEGGDGLQLVSAIRRNQYLSGIPFILMSGAVMKEDLQGVLGRDIDAVILKPFTRDLLLQKVEDALRRREEKEIARLLKR